MPVVEYLFKLLNISIQPNEGDLYGILSVFVLIFISILNIVTRESKTDAKKVIVSETEENFEVEHEFEEKKEEPKKPEAPKVSWSERLKKGLSKSRNEVWSKIGSLLGGDKLSEEALEQIEELLFSADMSPQIVDELLEQFKSQMSGDDYSEEKFKSFVHNFLSSVMSPIQEKVSQDIYESKKDGKTKVIMIVGVNGAGKTTTIGKLSTRLKNSGATVVVGACDTFRAAAIEQLEVWAERAGVELIKAKHGADPSGVAYDALAKAKSMNADYCILDTAGRLHTNANLMEELKKTKRVLSKLDETAPHEVFLVVDAITGQNALRQAEEFHKALDLTGLIFTKCDGSAKAGSAVSIVKTLQVPITYIGVGEEVEDLDKFSLNDYLDALVGVNL